MVCTCLCLTWHWKSCNFHPIGITIRISEITCTKNRLATLKNSRTKISRVGNTSRFKSTPTGTFEYTDHISQEQFHTLKSLCLLFINYKYRLAKRIWHFNESGQLHYLLNVFSFFLKIKTKTTHFGCSADLYQLLSSVALLPCAAYVVCWRPPERVRGYIKRARKLLRLLLCAQAVPLRRYVSK